SIPIKPDPVAFPRDERKEERREAAELLERDARLSAGHDGHYSVLPIGSLHCKRASTPHAPLGRMAPKPPPATGPKEREPLTESVTHTVEEARMLIPGVTAFLGFQLVAVFNTAFAQKLTRDEQMVHVGAMFLTLVALLLLLTPAAYHRQAESGWVSQGFVNLSSRLITGATPLFALGMTLDFYLLVRAVSENAALALVTALVILALTVVLWYGTPHVEALANFLRR